MYRECDNCGAILMIRGRKGLCDKCKIKTLKARESKLKETLENVVWVKKDKAADTAEAVLKELYPEEYTHKKRGEQGTEIK